jgi:hypothetical protein
MSTALIGRRRIAESRSSLIALLFDIEVSDVRVNTVAAAVDVLSARVSGIETEVGDEVGID